MSWFLDCSQCMMPVMHALYFAWAGRPRPMEIEIMLPLVMPLKMAIIAPAWRQFCVSKIDARPAGG